MADYPSRKPPRNPQGPSAPQGSPRGRGDPGDPLSGYFGEHSPRPAATHELIDGDAATRVASAQSLYNVEQTYQDPGVGFPTAPGGWQNAGHDESEAVTLTSDELRRQLHHLGEFVDPAVQYQQGQGGPYYSAPPDGRITNDLGYGNGQVYGEQYGAQGYEGQGYEGQGYDNGGYGGHGYPPAQVVDAVPAEPEYGMVVAAVQPEIPYGPPNRGGMGGGMESGYPPGLGAGSYSMLRVNPPEHIGSFSPDLVMMSHSDGYAAAQFRTLRYRIEQEPDLQIIMVTSAREGDGRSVTAANLALALAEGGRIQVLLIDGALRKPCQHELFGIRGDLGLTSVLAARQNDPTMPIDVIRITSNLSLIPAGPPVNSAHAALSSEAAAVLIGQIRREFRYIIVDSAPVFGTAETLAWHGLIDKYVLLARAGVTTNEDLTAASERLQREKIVGVVFVGARNKRK